MLISFGSISSPAGTWNDADGIRSGSLGPAGAAGIAPPV